MKRHLLFFSMLFFLTGLSSGQVHPEPDWIQNPTPSPFQGRGGHQMQVFQGKLWLFGGSSSTTQNPGRPLHDVWTTTDGIHWLPVSDTLAFETGHFLVFHDTLWCVSGRDIWNSADGIHWKLASTVDQFPQYGARAVVFKDRIWLTGGVDVEDTYLPNGALNPERKITWKNDVWSSADGIRWTRINCAAPFSNRSDHSLVVFNDKMWIIAGQSGPNKNDIWYSGDGSTWVFAGEAPFKPRHVAPVVSFGSQLWLFGGFAFDDSGHPVFMADVWRSSDGTGWTEVTFPAPFGGRIEHAVKVFKNKIWLVGGIIGTFEQSTVVNDVWSGAPEP